MASVTSGTRDDSPPTADPGAVRLQPGAAGGSTAASRRPSVSEPGAAAPNGTAGDKPAMKPLETVAYNEPAKSTYLERHPEHADEGWSRGKKICCCLSLLLLAALITIGVLIAFMVRVPTIEYRSLEIICPNDAYIRCAREQIQIRAFLDVDNPNILGATINADLGLYKTDGTFLGPGTIEDTDVKKSGVTEVQALFTLESDRGYDILLALFVPPQQSVDLLVKGTVYVHVGLLRPSTQIEETFTVPPQSITDVIGDLIEGLDIPAIPSTGDVVDAVTDAVTGALPSQEDVTDAVTGALPSEEDVRDAVEGAVRDGAQTGIDAIPDDAPTTIIGQIPGVPDSILDRIPNIRSVDNSPGGSSNLDVAEGDGAAASAAAPAPAAGASEGGTLSVAAPPRSQTTLRVRPAPQSKSHPQTTTLNVAQSQPQSPRRNHVSPMRSHAVNPKYFSQALLAIGAPNSEQRKRFEGMRTKGNSASLRQRLSRASRMP